MTHDEEVGESAFRDASGRAKFSSAKEDEGVPRVWISDACDDTGGQMLVVGGEFKRHCEYGRENESEC